MVLSLSNQRSEFYGKFYAIRLRMADVTQTVSQGESILSAVICIRK